MVKFVANGYPKTGTHALIKALELLGAPDSGPDEAGLVIKHVHHPYEDRHLLTPGAKHLCIFRNPRNVLISCARFNGTPLQTGYLRRLIKEFKMHGMTYGPMVDYAKYLPWREDQNTLCVNYEELTTSDVPLRRIAEFTGLEFVPDALPNLPGLTVTWTGAPSHWEDHWTPELDATWRGCGMADLEKRMGYDNVWIL